MGKNYGKICVLAAGLLSAACESEEDRLAEAHRAAADSMADARARGETDLSNPEMGSKVLLTITDSTLEQSGTVTARGQVSFAIQNKSREVRIVEVTGKTGTWTTFPIPENGGYVVLSMLLDPGQYTISAMTRDTTAAARATALKGRITAE